MKAGLIGCGLIARSHARAYADNQVTVAAVTDVNPEAASRLAGELGTAACFPGYRELIDSGTVDMISICTPPAFHRDAAVYALQHTIPVLCEKPLAHSVPAAQAITRAAAGSRAVLMTAFRHRFLPAIRKMKDVLSGNVIGDPVLFRNTFCAPAFDMDRKWFSKKSVSGGGCLMDTSSHSVDLFRFLCGEVVSQQAVMHTRFKNTDVEDAGIIILKSENGTVGSIHAAWAAGAGEFLVDLIGTRGRLTYDYTRPEELVQQDPDHPDGHRVAVEGGDGFSAEVASFIAAAKGTGPLEAAGRDGLRAVEIIQACY